MVNIIKKSIPVSVKKYYWRYLKRRERINKARIKFDGKTAKETFTFIYNTNYWNGTESVSGGGSDLVHTQEVVKRITELIKDLNIQSVLDVPCGDFLWMQYVDLEGVSYTGGDIVDDLIQKNTQKYHSVSNTQFKTIDLLKDELPKADIIINRDCLVHLSFNDIFIAIEQIRKSGCSYLLTTTFPNHLENKDIVTGEWRTLNLEAAPFNFKPPIKLINENFNHSNYKDKSLGLWKIDEI